ncbi:hypothetical protein GCM10010436_89580 [Paractinoplanes durhamensis]
MPFKPDKRLSMTAVAPREGQRKPRKQHVLNPGPERRRHGGQQRPGNSRIHGDGNPPQRPGRTPARRTCRLSPRTAPKLHKIARDRAGSDRAGSAGAGARNGRRPSADRSRSC